jgi:hypothetical protein
MQIHDSGEFRAPLVDNEEAWEGRWLSGSVPVRYAVGIGGKLGLYQPRYLSNGGRLFFDSTDALVPQDVNHSEDVYEYEPKPNGEAAASDDCSETGSTFSAAADGCIDLISAGTSTEESVFLDASENGNDVFFLTASKLTNSDIDTAYDVYDAHSCGVGASWACTASVTVSSTTCESDAACKASQQTGGGVALGLPASEVFEGAGNLVVSADGNDLSTLAKCPKGKRRSGGKCVATKRKRDAKKSNRARATRAGARTGNLKRGRRR